MEKEKFVDESSIFGNQLHIMVNRWYSDEAQIKNVLTGKSGINIKRISKIVPTLEDVFIHLLEKDKN